MGVIFTTGGAGVGDLSAVTANASDVLNPKVIVDKNGNPLTGTMTNNGAFTRTTEYGQSVTIPEGYHNGQGAITGGEFNFQGTAGTGEVLSGQTFYANNGNLLTGTMTNQGAWNGTVSVGSTLSIPAGYHNGSGKVSVGGFNGNAATGDVLTGQTFYSNSGTRQTGTMTDLQGRNSSNNGKVTAGGLWFDNNYPNGVSVLLSTTGYIKSGNTVLTWTDPAAILGNWTGVDDRNGNNIRISPTSSASTAAFHYTGRIGGGNSKWREVFVYGWQYDESL